MLRKPITYKNIDGVEVTEEYYFHLTKAEVIELQYTMQGGLAETLEKIGKLDVNKPGNAALILRTFREIIKSSFGRRTPDGGFVKREADWEVFSSGEAYSALFMEMVSDAAFAAEFVRGVLPEGLDIQQTNDATGLLAAATQQSVDVELPDVPPVSEVPAWIRQRRDPTGEELVGMSKLELLDAMKAKTTGKFPGDEGF